jgi:hypothetical protein
MEGRRGWSGLIAWEARKGSRLPDISGATRRASGGSRRRSDNAHAGREQGRAPTGSGRERC